MRRKHLNVSVKNKLNELTEKNKNLTNSNNSLQKMANDALARSIVSQKKVSELENFNIGLLQILNEQKNANDY